MDIITGAWDAREWPGWMRVGCSTVDLGILATQQQKGLCDYTGCSTVVLVCFTCPAITIATPTKAWPPFNAHWIEGTEAHAHPSHAIRAYTSNKRRFVNTPAKVGSGLRSEIAP